MGSRPPHSLTPSRAECPASDPCALRTNACPGDGAVGALHLAGEDCFAVAVAAAVAVAVAALVGIR